VLGLDKMAGGALITSPAEKRRPFRKKNRDCAP
jgi:hypothetical protein